MPKKKDSYEVEKLVDMRKNGKEFLVKWKGFPASQNTWEPVSNLGSVKAEMKAMLSKAQKPKAPIAKKAKPAAKKSAAKSPKPAAKKPAAKSGKKMAMDVQAVALLIKQAMTGIKPPEKKKTAAPKKASTVVEVDKIQAMRVTKKGVQYKILWKDKTSSWEPEDNVMDDDLIDEFEEAKQVAAYGSEKLEVGSEVEVKNIIEGFENSWSAAVVKKKAGNKFTVEYTSFEDDDGSALVEGGLERKRLRLAPGAANSSWSPVVGEIVEVSDADCWWEARVEGIPSKGKLTLKFRVSDEVKTMALTKKVRPCSWLTLE